MQDKNNDTLVLDLKQLDQLIIKTKKIIDKQNTIVLLQGDLASGKTTFVKQYVKSLGIDDEVRSPTFSIQSIYAKNIYHYDVYNKSLEAFIALGMLEEFEKDGIQFVEWGEDRLKKILLEYGFKVIKIKLKKLQDKREYRIDT
jgi:tRNA threonylcarbamoyladenosine biosynthesis protein TsaE